MRTMTINYWQIAKTWVRESAVVGTALCGLLLGAPPAAAQTAAPAPDSAAWVESTLKSLSLRAKIGQMVIAWTGGEYVAVDSPEFDRLREWVERDGIGGLILSIGTPHGYAAKLNALQRRAAVPLLAMTDMESGPGMRLAGAYTLPHLLPQGGGTVFPPVMALGAVGDDSLAFQVGMATAREARAVGVHMTLAPVLDVNSNPNNPIINVRSFGEDPHRAARLAAAYIRGAHAGGLLTAGKHFPGHGDTEVDSHLALPAIRGNRARLDSVELVPFRAAIAANVDGMLVGHLALVDLLGPEAPPASLSPFAVDTLLRRQLGFGGLVITDALNMGAVVRRYGNAEAAVRAVEAGADLLLQPPEIGVAMDAVVDAVRSGRLTESRIDAAVRRILAAKAAAGLHRQRIVDLDRVDEVVGSRAHTELARQVAERSLVLARNRNTLLPLTADARRVLVVAYAGRNDLVAGRAFAAELRAAGHEVQLVRVDEAAGEAEWSALRKDAATADRIVAAMFVQPRESRGSVAAGDGFASLIRQWAEAGKPVIGISFGSPYLLGSFPTVPAFVLAWGGGEPSQRAAARALVGKIPMPGQPPVTLEGERPPAP